MKRYPHIEAKITMPDGRIMEIVADIESMNIQTHIDTDTIPFELAGAFTECERLEVSFMSAPGGATITTHPKPEKAST